jgi:hypothetical protein
VVGSELSFRASSRNDESERNMEVGLDLEALDFTIESIEEFARRELPESRLIELDEKDEFPEELVRYGDTIELEVELPFETGAPMEAIRAAAAGEVHE